MINWNCTKHEYEIIHEIASRARVIALKQGHDIPLRDWLMDIEACHCNGCRLKLSELAQANPFDFTHDVFGIRQHINRSNGQLEDCFLPRYAGGALNEV